MSDFELGVLNALGFIAFPTLGLFAGVLMDRVRRKPVMIAVNVIRLVTLSTIPITFLLGVFGVVGLYQLYTVALILGTCQLFFDVGYQSYLPSLVAKEDVVEGNEKLQVSASAAQVAGPSVASALMGLVGTAQAVVADVVGFITSVLFLASIRKPEEKPKRDSSKKGQENFFAEMKEGIQIIRGNKLLWTQAGCTAITNLGMNIFNVAILLYAYRVLNISKDVIGVAFSIGAVGFVVGVFASSTITKRLGVGKTIALSCTTNFGLLISLLAGVESTYAVAIIGVAMFVSNLGIPIYNINMVSLRQLITPNRLQGRMNATMRTIIWGTIPLGAFLGGIFCTAIGLVATLVVGGIIAGLSALWVILGPIYKLKKHPQPVQE